MALEPLSVGVIGALLIVVGLILAFFGGTLVRTLMGIVGALIGGSLGYVGGTLLSTNLLLVIGLAVIGAVLGALFFSFILRLGVSLAVGLLAGAAVWTVIGGGSTDPVTSANLIAIVVVVLAFALAYVLFKRLLGLFTALAGGLLVGLSIDYLGIRFGSLEPTIAGAIGLVIGVIVVIAGAVRQWRKG